MRIISEKRLWQFSKVAKGSEAKRRRKAMREWITVVKGADWNKFSDISNTFNHSDVYCSRVIFDVGGNQYRIIAKTAYKIRAVFIRDVLTHAEYDVDKWKGDCEE